MQTGYILLIAFVAFILHDDAMESKRERQARRARQLREQLGIEIEQEARR